MKIRSMQDLLVDQLRDLFGAEKHMLKALTKMAKAAGNPALRQALQEHRQQTEEQVERLERAFEHLGVAARKKRCAGVEGIVEEGEELMEADAEPDLLDAALIAVAQKVEHYEMAGYGTLRTWARQVGDEQTSKLLQQTLDEEGKTDKLLTQLAESTINIEAAQPG